MYKPENTVKIEKYTAKNNSPTFKIIKNDRSVYLHSAYNPQDQARKQVNEMNIREDSIIICFGLGLGYHIYELLDRIKDSGRIIIIEPSKEIFEHSCKYEDVLKLDGSEKISMIISNDFAEISEFLQENFGELETDKIKTFRHPVYKILFPSECEIFLGIIKEVWIAKAVNLATTLMKGNVWLTNTIKNLVYIMDSHYFNIFKDEFRGVPVILVAGGPSLNKNVHLLKNIGNEILIICMYTAYKVLKNLDIKPHFLIASDSHQTSLESEEDKLKRINVPLIYQSFLDKSLLDRTDGEKIFFTDYSEVLVPKLLESQDIDVDRIHIGGSIACVCLSIAKYFGASQIILIGQDLAFDGERSHARGTYYDGVNSSDLSDTEIFVEGYNGEKLKTSPVYLSFKTWIEDFIKKNKNEIEFIDATEGGALIKGTKIMTLADAIEYCKNNKKADIEMKIKTILKKDKMLSPGQKEGFKSQVKSILNDLFALLPGISEAAALCSQLENMYLSGNVSDEKKEEILKKLDEIDAEITSANNSLSVLSFAYTKIFLDIKNIKDDKYLDNDINILRQNSALYEGLKQLIADLQEAYDFLFASGKL